MSVRHNGATLIHAKGSEKNKLGRVGDPFRIVPVAHEYNSRESNWTNLSVPSSGFEGFDLGYSQVCIEEEAQWLLAE